MKKTSIVLLLAFCVLMLAACSGTKPEETTGSETAAQAETETGTEAASASGTTDVDTINAIIDAFDLTEPDSMGTVEKLGQYKGIELAAVPHTEIGDDEVEDYINNYILPNFVEEADTVMDGDTASIDYIGTENGVAFENGTGSADLVIGSNSFIDGFESGLIGKKSGETVVLSLKFPEDYGAEELAGHEVEFEVKINSVKRQRKLDDALAKEINEDCDSVEELKKATKELLQTGNDLNEMQSLYYEAVKAVIDDSEITPDVKAIEYTTNNYIRGDANNMKSSGFDIGTLLSYYGMSYEEYRASYDDISSESVKQRAVLREIARLEGITVTDEDISAFAKNYGYDDVTIREALGEKLLMEVVLEEKANKFIVDNATLTEQGQEG